MAATELVRRACGCEVEASSDFVGWCRECLEDYLVRDAASAIAVLRRAGVDVEPLEETFSQQIADTLSRVK